MSDVVQYSYESITSHLANALFSLEMGLQLESSSIAIESFKDIPLRLL